jgi:predicted RND superfamily exporter protein
MYTLALLQVVCVKKDKNNRRTENTMTKRQEYQEDRQYNDQKTNITGGQTIQWSKDKHNRRTENTMTKVIVFSVLLLCLSFGHCIVCPPVIFVFWSLYFLSSCYVCLLVIVLSVLLLFLWQKIQWPKDKHNRRTENTMIKRQT